MRTDLILPPIRLQVDIPHTLAYDVNNRLISAKRSLQKMNLYRDTYPLKLVEGYLVKKTDVEIY